MNVSKKPQLVMNGAFLRLQIWHLPTSFAGQWEQDSFREYHVKVSLGDEQGQFMSC